MRTIGVTGGVGCGKSAVMDYISGNYNAKVIYADDLARELQSPGHECYETIVSLLGEDILDPDGTINRQNMASAIFGDDILRKQVNRIVHPAVKEYIITDIEKADQRGVYDYYFLEAALLIEERYNEILDELWYVYADPQVRRSRLKASRGYSDEKIDMILASQLSDDEYTKYCRVLIDNSGALLDTYRQIDDILANY